MNEFIHKNIISRSGSYIKGLKPCPKKVNVLSEICFHLITFCQDNRINLCNVLLQLFVPQLLGFLGAMIYSKRSELDFSLV